MVSVVNAEMTNVHAPNLRNCHIKLIFAPNPGWGHALHVISSHTRGAHHMPNSDICEAERFREGRVLAFVVEVPLGSEVWILKLQSCSPFGIPKLWGWIESSCCIADMPAERLTPNWASSYWKKWARRTELQQCWRGHSSKFTCWLFYIEQLSIDVILVMMNLWSRVVIDPRIISAHILPKHVTVVSEALSLSQFSTELRLYSIQACTSRIQGAVDVTASGSLLLDAYQNRNWAQQHQCKPNTICKLLNAVFLTCIRITSLTKHRSRSCIWWPVLEQGWAHAKN